MLNYYVVYIVCCPLSCKINWAERSITQTEAEISTHRAQTPAILSRYAGLRQITAKHSKIHMKIEVNSSMKVVRRSIENNLPTSTTDRSFLRSNRCESKGETRLYLGRVDEEAKGIGSPPALCFRRAPVTRARERDGTNGRAAAKAGTAGASLYEPAWLDWSASAVAAGFSRRWEAAMSRHGVTAALATAGAGATGPANSL